MADMNRMLAAPTDWTNVATQSDAIATAQRNGVAGLVHYITGISISASAAPAAAVTAEVRSGATVLDRFEIPNAAFAPIIHNYTRPLRAAPGDTVSLVLPALGGTTIGTAVIKGFTGTP